MSDCASIEHTIDNYTGVAPPAGSAGANAVRQRHPLRASPMGRLPDWSRMASVTTGRAHLKD